jgi:hypothetical protein
MDGFLAHDIVIEADMDSRIKRCMGVHGGLKKGPVR